LRWLSIATCEEKKWWRGGRADGARQVVEKQVVERDVRVRAAH
jgi:hypothetical protein